MWKSYLFYLLNNTFCVSLQLMSPWTLSTVSCLCNEILHLREDQVLYHLCTLIFISLATVLLLSLVFGLSNIIWSFCTIWLNHLFVVNQCAAARLQCSSVTKCVVLYSTVLTTPALRCATAGHVSRASCNFSRVSLTLPGRLCTKYSDW